jgi:GDPmannose 4,6-dehydratase
VGDIIVRVDPRYFRPTEVETLLGDASQARQRLGWVPEISLDLMIQEMVDVDLEEARKHALLKQFGYGIAVSRED